MVQEMEAIEALARVNVLCLDKTGTITTGDLEVVEVVPCGTMSDEKIREVMNEITFAFNDVNPTQQALMNYFEKTQKWQTTDLFRFPLRENIVPLPLASTELMCWVRRNSL